MKTFKIHLSLTGQPTAPFFRKYTPRGISHENFFPKLSVYVGHKFNTV